MGPRSLTGRLLLLLVALVGATLIATTIAALTAADANVRNLVREDLEVRSRVASLALRQQADALRQRVAVVTADYGFKAAAATGERDTVLSALANHGDRLGADLVMLLSPQGRLELSSAPLDEVPTDIRGRISAGVPRSSALLQTLVDAPYLLALSPVLAPTLSGWLVVGQALDRDALDRLAQLSGGQVSFIPPPADGAGADTATDAPVAKQHWMSTLVDLGDLAGSDAPALRLSVSLREALADFDPLRTQLVIIALIALALAIVLAIGASRWLTRPIRAMVDSARRIADGDYTHALTVRTGTELDTLSEALGFMRETVSEREARIQHQAQHDLLTQLPNRNYMYALYQRYLRENAQRAAFAIALVELEDLAQIRDLYGSEFCDQVLRKASQRIAESLRRGDIAGRVGDQQILLFLQGMKNDGVDTLLQKIDELGDRPLQVDGVPVTPELRLGFAFSPAHGMDFDDLQRRAQLALTEARRSGRRHEVYTVGRDERHLRQIRIANRLQAAIAENAFRLLYQAKFDLRQRRVTGAEALLRWDDRELGPVYPDEFIPIAEQTGIITSLSEWVVDRVIADQQAWRRSGVVISVSVNLSGVDVLKRGFVDRIVDRVGRSGLPVEAIVLEVTETAMMADAEVARSNMERIERLGMRISIDDYGTGFSSLAQLRTLPVRELKLDRSLVESIATEEGDRLIVRSTIEMAHHLGLEVVAEGVETVDVLQQLAAMGCDMVQGYLLARPMPVPELGALLASEEARTQELREALDAA